MAAYLERLETLGTKARPHEVSTFHEHLIGTWRILTAWGLPDFVCDAGMFHSIYGHPSVAADGLWRELREDMAQLVGHKAENLIFLFSILDRRHLYEGLAPLRQLPSTFDVPIRASSGPLAMSMCREVIAQLVVIDLANLAEQSHSGDLSPELWMWKAVRLAQLLSRSAVATAPPFAKGSLTEQSERSARTHYLDGLDRLSRDTCTAGGLLLASARANPFVGEPLIALAYLNWTKGNHAEASAQARRGLARLTRLATPWDKRAPFETWAAFGKALQARPS